MRAYRATSMALSATLLVLGVVLLVMTLARGGGPLATGVLVGLLFCAAGAGRLYAMRSRD